MLPTLAELFKQIERNEQRKKEQAEKGFDGLTFFVYRAMLDAGVENAGLVSGQVRKAFADHPHWRNSEADLRELRNEVTFAICAQLDDLDEVAKVVDELFNLLANPSEAG